MDLDSLQPLEQLDRIKLACQKYRSICVATQRGAKRPRFYDARLGKYINIAHFESCNRVRDDLPWVTQQRMSLIGTDADQVERTAQISSTSRL